MIAPLLQSQIPTLPGEPLTNTPETDSFAEILASAMPVPQLPVPTPVPDPAPPAPTVLLASEQEPGAPSVPAPLDGLPSAGTTQPIAEMFNEFGFFAADMPPTEAAATSQPNPMLESEALSIRVEDSVQSGSDARVGSGLRSETFVDSFAAKPSSLSDAPAHVVRQTPVVSGVALRAAKVPVEEATPATAAAAPRRPSLGQPTARSAVQVTAREIEQGLHIAARIDALGESEREAMRDEILALLSRHGLAPRTLRINGPIAATALHERKQ